MAAPADPRFATDATFAADGDTWSGDPNKVDPGSGRVAEGFEPTTLPAEWLNWQLNLLGQWAHYVGASASRVLRLSPWKAWGGSSSVSAAPTWIRQVFSTGSTQGFNLASGSDAAALHLCLSDFLPDGCTITRIRVAVKPGAARATTGNRMALGGFDHELTWGGTPTSGFHRFSFSDVVDDGTTAAQILDSGTIALVNDRPDFQIIARCTAGNDAGTNRDLVYGWEITYTGPKILVED